MTPFLKWAGGKRWLFSEEFVSTLPVFRRYVEPFLGGGAGFFALNPSSAVLSDLNPDLINLYKVVRDHPESLRSELLKHQHAHSAEHYYRTRSDVSGTEINRAARFLYLNRTCYNGLYRLNLKGEFNVPIGTKTQVVHPSEDFTEYSRRLRNATILVCDFEEVIDQTQEGDLVFVDPPYTVAHNINGFVKYNERIFSWGDQVRLRGAIMRANSRGAHIIVSNADHASVRELYSSAQIKSSARRHSVMSGKASGRSGTTELIVRLPCTL